MTADSAKHAEMDQMEQTTQRFLDLWFSENTDGIEEIVAENFVSYMSMPGVNSTGLQQISVTIHYTPALRILGCFAFDRYRTAFLVGGVEGRWDGNSVVLVN